MLQLTRSRADVALRRGIFAITAVATDASLTRAGCGASGSRGVNPDDSDGRSPEFAGTELSVPAEPMINYQILAQFVPEFTEMAGISVTIETAPFSQLTPPSGRSEAGR